MSHGEFADLLEASLGALRRERPRSHRRLVAAMSHRPIRFEVEGDAFVLDFDETGPHLHPPDVPSSLELGLSKQTILDLVQGVISFDEAIWSDALRLRGPVDELTRFSDALLIYLRAAVRCPSFPQLFDAYRSGRVVAPH
jgi:hypothetical protein